MKYLPIIDVWESGIETALLSGQLRLQSGQWIRCGKEGPPSRFDYSTKWYIRAYHGPRASAKYREAKRHKKEHEATLAARESSRNN